MTEFHDPDDPLERFTDMGPVDQEHIVYTRVRRDKAVKFIEGSDILPVHALGGFEIPVTTDKKSRRRSEVIARFVVADAVDPLLPDADSLNVSKEYHMVEVKLPLLGGRANLMIDTLPGIVYDPMKDPEF